MKGSGLGQYEEIKRQLAGETDEHHVSAAGYLTSGPRLETRGHRIQNRINNYSTGSFGLFYWQKVCVGSVTQQAPLCARKN